MLTTKPVVNERESEGGVGLVGLVCIVKAAVGLPFGKLRAARTPKGAGGFLVSGAKRMLS
jgi:hypothetical protein